MSITCKKCGAVNPDDSATICPSCGVVYAKAANAAVEYAPSIKSNNKPKKDRSISTIISVVMVAVIAVVVGVYLAIPQSVSGKVFIVTRGMTSIYLPLVTIRAYDATKLRQAMKERDVLYEQEKSKQEALIDKVDVLKASSTGSAATAKQILDLLSESDILNHINQPDFWFVTAPRPIAITQSDDKGAFDLKLQRGRQYIIVAEAKRDVAGSTEHYFWYVPYSSGYGLSGHTQLANDNRGEPGSKNSMFPNGF
jgi:hypothetical protein